MNKYNPNLILSDSVLDEHVSYLWKKLSNDQNNEQSRKTHPKILYLFEFVINTSKIEEINKSKAYIEIQTIDNFDLLLKKVSLK